MTPYNYCYNNPVRYIDRRGLEGEDFDPDKTNILPEVVVTAPKPDNSGLYSFWAKFNSYNQPGAMAWTNPLGQGAGPYTADYTEYMGSNASILNMIGFDWLGFYSIFGKISDAKKEFYSIKKKNDTKIKSDEDILKESTGIGPKTDSQGQIFGEGKYKTWRRTDHYEYSSGDTESRFEDGTGDSILYTSSFKDSVLLVPWQPGTSKERYKTPLNNKK